MLAASWRWRRFCIQPRLEDMQAPSTNSSSEFLFAKLHGMWANAVKGERLDKLLNSTTPEILQRNLHDIGLDGSNREAFHLDLIMRKLRILDSAARMLDSTGAAFYRALSARSFYEDLKTIIHERFVKGESPANISRLLISVPLMPEFDLHELFAAKNTEAFVKALPLEEIAGGMEIRNAIFQLDKDGDFMAVDSVIDQQFFNAVISVAEKMPQSIRKYSVSLVGGEIDAINISMLLRNARTYHFSSARMRVLLLANGWNIDGRQLRDLAQLDTLQKIIAHLPAVYNRLLAPLTDTDLYKSENAMWNFNHKQALKCFRDFTCPDCSIVAFPFLIHYETLNIWRIFEGIHFGIPARDIQDMMIGA